MQIHELGTKTVKKTQRVARGGRRGTYSGRGQKGQKSRAGRRMRPAMRDLIARIPKKRGFRNKPHTEKPFVVSVTKLMKLAGEVTVEVLKKERIVPKRFTGVVKVIGLGDVKKPITLKGILTSVGAKKAIEKAGGKVEGSE